MWNRADQFVDVALDLFDEHGFDGTTIEMIASSAGVSPATISEEIGGKDMFLLSGIYQTAAELNERIRRRPSHELPMVALREHLIERITELFGEQRRLRQLIHLSDHPAVLGKAISQQVLVNALEDAFAEREHVTPEQAEILAIHGAALVRYVFARARQARGNNIAGLVRSVFRQSHEVWRNYPVIG